jgi:hypothetical protein
MANVGCDRPPSPLLIEEQIGAVSKVSGEPDCNDQEHKDDGSARHGGDLLEQGPIATTELSGDLSRFEVVGARQQFGALLRFR